jgi:hypothetical protein
LVASPSALVVPWACALGGGHAGGLVCPRWCSWVVGKYWTVNGAFIGVIMHSSYVLFSSVLLLPE